MKELSKSYATKINSLLKKIIKEEGFKFTKCAKLIRNSYKKGGQLYIFGTGHSRLLGEEAFHRAGGFAAACPIRDDNLIFQKADVVFLEGQRFSSFREIHGEVCNAGWDWLSKFPIQKDT